MKGCGRCWTDAELDALDGDPALLPDELVHKFASEVMDHFEPDEYWLAWRRLAPRVVRLLNDDPNSQLTWGLTQAQLSRWPQNELDALRTLLAETVVRAAHDEQRRAHVADLLCAAAQLDQDLAPWVSLVDGFPDAVVAELARWWSYDVLSGVYDWGWLFWDDLDQPVQEWLLAPALRARLSEVDSEDAQWAVCQIDMLGEISTR